MSKTLAKLKQVAGSQFGIKPTEISSNDSLDDLSDSTRATARCIEQIKREFGIEISRKTRIHLYVSELRVVALLIARRRRAARLDAHSRLQ